MRVLMISKACIVGIYQQKLAAMAAMAPDLDLTVIVPPFWRDERGKTFLERGYTHGYHLEVVSVLFNGDFHLHVYPTLRRSIARYKPDLVHIDEEPYNLATYHANRLSRRFGAKTLWFSWQNLQRRYPPPFSWIERYNLRNVDHALVGSRTAEEVWRAKGYHGGLDIIPQFGVDPALFCPPAQRPVDTPLHIVYVGRLVAEKGCDVLVEALGDLAGNWRATFLGSGPLLEPLRRQAASLAFGHRITFTPWLPSNAMPDFYRTADLLVLPSRPRLNWTEQFGRVLIEAMASGVAVAGSDVGEIPHVIGDAGLLFPAGNAEALSAVLASLVSQPARGRGFGERGRNRVLACFTQHQVAAATLAVYRKLLA